ncbi:MAG: penicillin-binding protein 1C [Chitinophagaceae bacterium]|nr:penicillin-binding protein 1C [Chitinophagaceae bacterium]
MIKLFSIPAVLALLLLISLNFLFPVTDKVEKIQYSTIITDSKGQLIHAFLTNDDKWRMKTTLEEMSPLLKKTIIEKEDRFFYYHFGINPFSIIRAFGKNILKSKRTSGASTITMQVARALERRPRTYASKFVEMFRAIQLELYYSKSEILRLYCNLLPYGGNIEGVKSASLLYFKKDPDHLSLAEITALSIIPNRPSSLVPGRNNDVIITERNRWLRIFAEEKIFSEKEIVDALAEPLDVTRGNVPRMAPHLSRLLERRGEPIVQSSLDLNMQLKAEKIVSGYARTLRLKNIHNAAVVVIDNATRQVITYIGSADFSDTTDGGQVDGARAIRQPGSTLKPLLYGMCIDEGLITPKSIIHDVNINYGGYSPENYDKKFNGNVTIEYALEHSLNIPAVRCLRQLGTEKFVQSLASCDFLQVRKDQKKLGLSMVLGGCGTSLLELTSLFSSFANNGEYARPSFVLNEKSSHKFPVLSASAAFMINDVLSKINRPDFPLSWQSTEHMPKIAWKTGTSYGRRDAWSIGYNKKYTVGVWTGNFSGEGVRELSGSETATPLLFRIFNTIDYDSDESWFNQPEDCDIRIVCAETGMLPDNHCTNRITDYFIPMISPATVCNDSKEVRISPDEKISYCRSCAPASGYKKKWYKIVSPEMQVYYEGQHIAYQEIPPHNPACEQLFRNDKPQILSPKNQFEYLISRNDPEPLQLQCRAGNDVGRVYWYIDNHFYKTSDAHTPVYFLPSEGPVKISCTDDKGRNRDVWISVKYVEM